MKKILNYARQNILVIDIIFIVIFIFFVFLFQLFNIRFLTWFLIVLIVISILGFVVGLIQQFWKVVTNKKLFVLVSFLIILFLGLVSIPLFQFLSLGIFFSYRPEHSVVLDDKHYVAVVSAFLNVDVNYYDDYGPFLMGTKIRVYGDFGAGSYDPFLAPYLCSSVTYTYFNPDGTVESQKSVQIIKDEEGNITDQYISDVPLQKDDFSDLESYLLPEEEEVLYERSFENVVLRFAKVDNSLPRNMSVNVLRSTDEGKNFYFFSDETISVSIDGAKFEFVNEQLGFAAVNGKIYLSPDKTSMYVTNDSGKTFSIATFEYTNPNVEYLTIDKMPYYEGNILKFECSVYDLNSNRDGYEIKNIIFVSEDLGNTWKVEES